MIDFQPKRDEADPASTVHAFQGRTIDTVIACAEANHPDFRQVCPLQVKAVATAAGAGECVREMDP